MMNAGVLTGLLRKEFAQLFRDKIMMLVVLWLYTVEIVMCPLALTFDVKNSPLAIVDHDRTSASRALVERFTATEAFDFVAALDRKSDAEDWLDRGEANLILILPSGFQRTLVRGDPASYQVLIDGSNSNVAANVKAYVHGINALYLRDQFGAGPIVINGLKAVTRVWYNPEQSSVQFMALSMIALAGMMVGTALPAASLVREKEQGTIEQLLVTPIRTWQLFLAKILPPLIMCLLAIFPGILLGTWLFDLPMRGNFGFFLLQSALFLVSAIALGVFIGVYSQTLQQALLLSFFGLFPILFLSGTVTPIESMPVFLQTLSRLSPLRYYMDMLLGVFLKGAGWRELWPESLALVLIALVLFGSALFAFKRRYA